MVKKNSVGRGVGCRLPWETWWVSKPRAVAKPLYRGSKSKFADEECYTISAVSKI